MGYYMRFLTQDSSPLSFETLNTLLKSRNSNWRLKIQPDAKRPSATIHFGDELLGKLEVNQPGDGLFGEEIEELLEFIDGNGDGDRVRVEHLLANSKVLYAVHVLWQEREAKDTLAYLDTFWDVLFEQHSGLLQADGEGYYDSSKLILQAIR